MMIKITKLFSSSPYLVQKKKHRRLRYLQVQGKREEKTISDSECIVYSSEKCDFMMEADFFVFNEIEQNATSNKIFGGKGFFKSVRKATRNFLFFALTQMQGCTPATAAGRRYRSSCLLGLCLQRSELSLVTWPGQKVSITHSFKN